MIERPLCITKLDEYRSVILKNNSPIIILMGEHFVPHTPKKAIFRAIHNGKTLITFIIIYRVPPFMLHCFGLLL